MALHLPARSEISIKDILLPKPQWVECGNNFAEVSSVRVEMPFGEDEWKEILESAGLKINKESSFLVKGSLETHLPSDGGNNDESYSLEITSEGINVKAISESGFYWALMTLRQILDYSCEIISKQLPLKIPECLIFDWPSFPYRGFMIDTGRTFISTDELKREIATLSHYKMNIFHWHLTENEAWRLESKIFPHITDSIYMTRDAGKFYSIEECQEIERWAKKHNVTIIPEIDMPGHSAAFERAFGCDMQNPEGEEILKQLIDEACKTFVTSPYIHIGTDEVKFTNPDFVDDMVEFIRQRDKKTVSWNPGWSYSPGDIDLTQLWSFRGKSQEGIPAVDSRFHYINHFDIYSDIRALFRSNIYGKQKADDNIVGVEIALWTDRYIDNEEKILRDNNVYPLILTTAERSWRGGGDEYFDKLGVNMSAPGSLDYEEFREFENRLIFQKEHDLKGIPFPYVKQTNIEWAITDAFPNGGELKKIFPPEYEGIKEYYQFADSIFKTHAAYGGGVYLRHVWGDLIPAFYKAPRSNHTAYAFTQVFSPIEQIVGLNFETQNYSRSESDIPPKPGTWDYRGSKIWINGRDIEPPVWLSTHSVRRNDIALGNENAVSRNPIPVKLQKGWNTILIKLPVGEFSTPETRLVKWMFTCVLTDLEGKKEVDGLIYSPFAETESERL